MKFKFFIISVLFVYVWLVGFSFQAVAQNKVVVIPLMGDAPAPAPDPYPVPIPKTGQETCYNGLGVPFTCTSGHNQDGALQNGIPWPNPRFVIEYQGTVTDKLTGLMWVNSPTSAMTWVAATLYCKDYILSDMAGPIFLISAPQMSRNSKA